jgi:shikimate dehydrogenase
MPDGPSFLSILIGSFASPARENPTVAMIEAAYRHAGLDARYINCDVPPEALGDAVRGAQAMGWVGFNCSIPHTVAMAELVNALAPSAEIIGAVNCVVDREGGWVGENTDGQAFLTSLRTVTDPAGKHVVVFGAAARRADIVVNATPIGLYLGIRHWTGVDADAAVMQRTLAALLPS